MPSAWCEIDEPVPDSVLWAAQKLPQVKQARALRF